MSEIVTARANALASSTAAPSPWLTAAEAAARARVGLEDHLPRNARRSAARGADWRTPRTADLAEWIDSWLAGSTEPVEINRGLRGSR